AVVMLSVSFAVLATYDFYSSRAGLIDGITSIADAIGSNSTAALTFDDAQAATETLRAASVHPHITAAQLYTAAGLPLARHSRQQDADGRESLFDAATIRRGEPTVAFAPGRLRVLRPVALNQQMVGSIVIESDTDEVWTRVTGFIALVSVAMTASVWLTLMVS